VTSHTTQPKNKFIFLTLFFALWFGLSIFSFDVVFLTKGITQFFASGVSFYKTYFFLFWMFLCFAVLSFVPNFKINLSMKRAVGLTVLVMGFNIFSQIYFTTAYDLPFNDYSSTVFEGQFATTRLVHVHTLKPIMIFPMLLVGMDPTKIKAEPGWVYFNLLPKWIFVVGFILAVVFFLMLLWMLVQKKREWNGKYRWAFFFAYAISSYALAKSSIDGGPFEPEFGFYFCVWLALINLKEDSFGPFLKRGALYFAIFYGFSVIFYLFVGQEGYMSLVTRPFMYLPFLVFVITLVSWLSTHQRKWQGWALISLGLAIIFQWNYFFSWEVRHLLTPIAEGDDVLFLNSKKIDFPYQVKYDNGHLRIHSATSHKGERLWALYRKYRIPPAYYSFAVSSKSCQKENTQVSYGQIRVIHAHEIQWDAVSPFFTKFGLHSCHKRQSCDYWYEAHLKGCLPNTGDQLILSHLYQMGLDQFVVMGNKGFI
jgi:hypothetical protein